ncbi:NAD(P)H-dependent oxidoreductase [Kribbella sandramycini]|uniref:Chromate reductase n=1 Tax=Kribbella sandramycini TaxID=60450 RepID=A0A7Y4KUI9_9ACTN|nr:NADPH-dependent FMN reductase [Kribbella sandramycini]MBB6568534.1 chromate reductase [Kribbella sandramycini]NOL38878.1 NAD(P)H-dependent oxidoreductase [Kribbella sandramycini]
MTDIKILAISGSLRAGSLNTALLRAAQKHAPAGVTIELYDGLAELPHYNGDLDTEAVPASARELRDRIRAADGVLISTPEYNYSIPGGLKNLIDWASRPAATSALLHKPVAIMGAAPTNFGTVRAQLALRQVFVWTHSDVVVKPEVMVFKAHERFDEAGNLVDDDTIALVSSLVDALAGKVRATK